MTQPSNTVPKSGLFLAAATAEDLMGANPLSIRDAATVDEAIEFLVQKGFSAAPVIDDAGRPVGVISRADIIAHTRALTKHLPSGSEYFDASELTDPFPENTRKGGMALELEKSLVREIMTPAVFSVMPHTPVDQIVAQFLALKVHRLFVVDAAGVLVGVISALDVLRQLR